MRLALVLVAVLFSVSEALGSQGEAIYWLNGHGVHRMTLEGTGHETVVGVSVVQGGDLAVVDSGVFWADTGSQTINRYQFSGELTTTKTELFPYGLAVSGDTLVYSEMIGDSTFVPQIHIAELDGSINSSLTLRASHTAIHGEQIYWVDPHGLGDINRISFDGTGSERIWGPPPGQTLSDPDDLFFHERDG